MHNLKIEQLDDNLSCVKMLHTEIYALRGHEDKVVLLQNNDGSWSLLWDKADEGIVNMGLVPADLGHRKVYSALETLWYDVWNYEME